MVKTTFPKAVIEYNERKAKSRLVKFHRELVWVNNRVSSSNKLHLYYILPYYDKNAFFFLFVEVFSDSMVRWSKTTYINSPVNLSLSPEMFLQLDNKDLLLIFFWWGINFNENISLRTWK